MKKLAALLVFATIGLSSTAQNPHMFSGELTGISNTVNADCGSATMALVYEFNITQFSDNSYSGQTIAIVVKCPETYGANFFKVGATYKMELFDTDGGTNATIVNPAVLTPYNLAHNYWAGDIDRTDL
jgi:hypothetical protein